MRPAGSGGRYAGRNSVTRDDSTRIEWVQPIRSAITVAGIVGYAFSNSRMRGSTPSTIEPAGLRSYFGGASDSNAAYTVFRETPSTRAICETGNFSARRNRRISTQSSTLSTYFLPGSDRSDPARVSAQVLNLQLPRPVQFSRAADIMAVLACRTIRPTASAFAPALTASDAGETD